MRQQQKGLSTVDRVSLDACGAFVLPSPLVTQTLIENYMSHCDPWTPIVERRWLEGSDHHSPSLLLMKSLLLAGSRVSEFPSVPASSREFYVSSKALVLCAYEQNPVINIIACCLLGWWNQYELGGFSLDTSSHWLRTASGIAYDIGLHKEPAATWEGRFRRRLWWSLVVRSLFARICHRHSLIINVFKARDCQVSAARGQPSIINLDLSSVLPPSVNDFPRNARHAGFFVAYVDISLILASLCGSCQKGRLSNEQKTQTRNSLHRWIRELPSDLQYLSCREKPEPSHENFLARQLHIIYLAAVSILYCSTSEAQEVSATAVASSSFIATLLEEFIVRDEFRFLTAVFSFYIVSAAVPQIAAYWSVDFHADVKQNLEIITGSLSALSLKWPTARAAVAALGHREKHSSGRTGDSEPKILLPDDEARELLEGFDPGACCHWKQVFGEMPTPTDGDLSASSNPAVTLQSQGFESDDFIAPLAEEDINMSFSLPSCGPSDEYDDFGAWVFERYLNL